MKTKHVSLLLAGAIFVFSLPFAVPFQADAALADASRLVNMENSGAGAQGQMPPGFPWLSLADVMLGLSLMVVAAMGAFLIYMVVIAFIARHKKNAIRMHSHSALMHRHRY